jgi:hypothetical protein
MGKISRLAAWIVILCLCFAVVRSEKILAKDKKLAPAEVVSEHIKSLGGPEVLSGIKSRTYTGSSSVEFITGSVGELAGQCEFVSEEQRLGIFCRYNAVDYSQEHIAFDGKDVTISYISPGRRSPLGDFLNRYDGIIKEGLMGGVLSVSWPLLNIEPKRANKMKYKKRKIDGRELHELEYRPQKGLRDVKVKLYFDLDTFHHVRTEYSVSVLQHQPVKPIIPATRIDLTDPEAHYLLLEEYGDFREVDGMTLPHSYSIHYSREGAGSTFMARWTTNVVQWSHNSPINPQYYTAQ